MRFKVGVEFNYKRSKVAETVGDPLKMLRYFIVFSLLFIFVQPDCQKERLKVTVYYEALCYDSMVFISRQLYPSYGILKSHIDLQMVPYGKAFRSVTNGKTNYECQHGSRECYGNKVQACVLLNQTVDNDLKMSFIACTMATRNPASSTLIAYCASKLNMNSAAILACTKDEATDILVEKMANLTDSLNPQISFVPTITFNDKYDPISQDSHLNDFLRTACKELGSCAPSDCPPR